MSLLWLTLLWLTLALAGSKTEGRSFLRAVFGAQVRKLGVNSNNGLTKLLQHSLLLSQQHSDSLSLACGIFQHGSQFPVNLGQMVAASTSSTQGK